MPGTENKPAIIKTNSSTVAANPAPVALSLYDHSHDHMTDLPRVYPSKASALCELQTAEENLVAFGSGEDTAVAEALAEVRREIAKIRA